jgi:hypothetical protein
MPRLKNKVPKYSLHKPSGQAKVKWQGKTIYLGKYGTEESRAAYAKFIANLPKPREGSGDASAISGRLAALPAGEPVKVKELVLRFYQHALNYYVHPDGRPTGEHVTVKSALRPLNSSFQERLDI